MVEWGTEFAYDVFIPALVNMENTGAASLHALLPSRANHRTPAIPSQVKSAAGCCPHTTYHTRRNKQ